MKCRPNYCIWLWTVQRHCGGVCDWESKDCLFFVLLVITFLAPRRRLLRSITVGSLLATVPKKRPPRTDDHLNAAQRTTFLCYMHCFFCFTEATTPASRQRPQSSCTKLRIATRTTQPHNMAVSLRRKIGNFSVARAASCPTEAWITGIATWTIYVK